LRARLFSQKPGGLSSFHAWSSPFASGFTDSSSYERLIGLCIPGINVGVNGNGNAALLLILRMRC